MAEFGLFTIGPTDATFANAAAASILAHADISAVSVVFSVPEINTVGWVITADSSFSGDDNDFLMLVIHELMVEGYTFSSMFLLAG